MWGVLALIGPGPGLALKAARVLAPAAVGAGVFTGVAAVLGSTELKALYRSVRRRRKPAETSPLTCGGAYSSLARRMATMACAMICVSDPPRVTTM